MQQQKNYAGQNEPAFIRGIAQVCHEANKAWCEANGDYSQKSWAEAEPWQRDSAVRGVQFRLDNPDASPGAQHEEWMADKVKNGWKYGPVKNPETKEHPSLVPYSQLSESERKKDALFGAIVTALIN